MPRCTPSYSLFREKLFKRSILLIYKKYVAKSDCANFILKHSHFGLWDCVPHLPNHVICILSVEYTYPHTDKIFWVGKGDGGWGGVYLLELFRFSIWLIVKTSVFR